jgi:two-component system sensor histidine kinase UhpB
MVEDNPLDVELATHALQEHGIGFSLECVETKREFERQLAERPPDVILSDYALPTFDGLAALAIAKVKTPDVPFIFVTGTMGEEVAILTLKTGATDYVLKNRLTRLGSAVQRALRESVERKERKQAEENLHRTNEQLRALTSYLQQVREEERTRIARQVHDELGQALTGLKLDLSWLDNHLPRDARILHQKAKAMSAYIDTTIQTVRRIATELRPGILDDLGLIAAIEWQSHEFELRTGIQCSVHTDLTETMWPQDFSTVFFRIFQETLTNIIRHAQAKQVKVELAQEAGRLILTIHDNGRGITAAEAASSRSIGLVGMRERAALLGGEVEFLGLPGKGTTVSVRIPLLAAEPLVKVS